MSRVSRSRLHDRPPARDEAFRLVDLALRRADLRHCTEFLRVGGWLLVNSSHGDAALASIERSGRGIAYTKSPFAYLFGRIS